MTPEICTKTWVEYRNKVNQDGLGQRARAPHTRLGGYQAHTQMRDVRAGDAIIHLIQRDDDTNWFIGSSVARSNVRQDDTNYIVPLKDFVRFPEPLSYDEFANRNKKKIEEILNEKPHYQPFQRNRRDIGFKIPQGYYFGVAVSELTKILGKNAGTPPASGYNQNVPGRGGPARGGVRLSVIWEARQNPLVIELVSYLERQGFRGLHGYNWMPDVLMGKSDVKVLIEVKPVPHTHDIITAIGQIICYRSSFDKIISIIAAKGSLNNSDLIKVMKYNLIKYVNLSGNWKKAIVKLVQD